MLSSNQESSGTYTFDQCLVVEFSILHSTVEVLSFEKMFDTCPRFSSGICSLFHLWADLMSDAETPHSMVLFPNQSQ